MFVNVIIYRPREVGFESCEALAALGCTTVQPHWHQTSGLEDNGGPTLQPQSGGIQRESALRS